MSRANLEHQPTQGIPFWGELLLFPLYFLASFIGIVAWFFGQRGRVEDFLCDGIGRLIYEIGLDPYCEAIKKHSAVIAERQRRVDEAVARMRAERDRLDEIVCRLIGEHGASFDPNSGASGRKRNTLKRQTAALQREFQEKQCTANDDDDCYLRELEIEAATAAGHRDMLVFLSALYAALLLSVFEYKARGRGEAKTLEAIVDAIEAFRRRLLGVASRLVPDFGELISELLSPHVLAAGTGGSLFVPRI